MALTWMDLCCGELVCDGAQAALNTPATLPQPGRGASPQLSLISALCLSLRTAACGALEFYLHETVPGTRRAGDVLLEQRVCSIIG